MTSVELRRGDQCRFDQYNSQNWSAMKSTAWLRNSFYILERVAKRCCGGHVHQPHVNDMAQDEEEVVATTGESQSAVSA